MHHTKKWSRHSVEQDEMSLTSSARLVQDRPWALMDVPSRICIKSHVTNIHVARIGHSILKNIFLCACNDVTRC